MTFYVGFPMARRVARETPGQWVTSKTCRDAHEARQLAESRNALGVAFEWRASGRYLLCRTRETS